MKSASLFVGVPSAMIVLGLLLSTTPAGAVLSTGWGEAEPISAYDHDAGLADVAVDASGNAVAVWCQFDGTRVNIYANRYVVGSGWEGAEPIEANDGDADWPAVAVDGSGNAIAVWMQYDGTRDSIWANRYVVGTGKWGVAELIETDDAGNAWLPTVAADASGNAIAVWMQSDGTRVNIWANRYVTGAGWGVAEPIEADDAGDARYPAVAVDGSGDAVAVWDQFDGTRYNIYANRYVVGIGWGEEAEPIEANDGAAVIPAVAVDASGNAITVWYQSDGTSLWNIWANRYDVVAGWGDEVELIDTSGAMPDWFPAVAAGASGNAIAVWPQSDGTRVNIYANRYVVGSGWEGAEPIEADDGGASMPAVAVDGSGNAVAVWNQSDDALSNIYANRYVVGSGWEGAELIETNNAGPAFLPRVAADASGNAMAVWMLFSGDQAGIWANRYVVPDVTPPPLTLSSPVDGTTTDSPLIVVSGKTEPGATVSANGVLAAVLGDGSFSCVIALKQGSNTIVVTATDPSGNSVTISRTVVYDATLPDVTDEFDDELLDLMDKLDEIRDELNATEDELGKTNDTLASIRSQNLMLTVALVAVGAIAAVSLAMYFSLRKMMPPSGNAPVRTEPPPPPGG